MGVRTYTIYMTYRPHLHPRSPAAGPTPVDRLLLVAFAVSLVIVAGVSAIPSWLLPSL